MSKLIETRKILKMVFTSDFRLVSIKLLVMMKTNRAESFGSAPKANCPKMKPRNDISNIIYFFLRMLTIFS